ncbi:MAG: protein phosphatase 2C domain-containing protein [Coriobacteriales bacterium]|nr:protein phosphatase 2C domain-containing protein [Coriobacteriales bacterium]
MKLSYAVYTNPGGRDGNEDSYGVATNDGCETGAEAWLFVVADGLGGHGGGETASALAVEQALAAFEADPDNLAACFERGQEAILSRQATDTAVKDMKTTMVALSIKDDQAAWGHIGDSRLYWFTGGHLRTRTLDHSVPQILVATGEIREEDIRHHEDRNRLIKAMGIEWPTPAYELAEVVQLAGNDSFLLATDGFWEYVEEKDMERALRHAVSPSIWLRRMLVVGKKNACGHDRDNYTAIAVFAREH